MIIRLFFKTIPLSFMIIIMNLVLFFFSYHLYKSFEKQESPENEIAVYVELSSGIEEININQIIAEFNNSKSIKRGSVNYLSSDYISENILPPAPSQDSFFVRDVDNLPQYISFTMFSDLHTDFDILTKKFIDKKYITEIVFEERKEKKKNNYFNFKISIATLLIVFFAFLLLYLWQSYRINYLESNFFKEGIPKNTFLKIVFFQFMIKIAFFVIAVFSLQFYFNYLILYDFLKISVVFLSTINLLGYMILFYKIRNTVNL